MHLTKQEERVYNGEYGWAYQIAMKILVRLGDLFGATQLIPISSAHLSGVSYKILGDAPLEFLEALASTETKVQVASTTNPSSLDPEYLSTKFSEKQRKKQVHVLDLYKRIGATLTLTCTPYYLEEPKQGCHLAWSESSAAIYANSVLGACTNREGGPSALAAALIGKVPNHGLHQPENREPNILVKVEASLQNQMEYGALGSHVGRLLKDKVPLFTGLPTPSKDELKQLGAGLASSGMTCMFHYQKRVHEQKLETITVEAKDVKNEIENLSTISLEAPELVFIGCPHCSLNEIRKVAQLIEGRKVKGETEFWVCTSGHIKQKAKKYVDVIEKAGGHVLSDTCAIVTWIKDLQIYRVATNSAKAAHYTPTLNKAEVTLASIEKCVAVACS